MYYRKLIASRIGTSDTATVGLVEELMRAEHGTLDHLTPAEFTDAIAAALVEARDLAATGQLGAWCTALDIPVPVR
jgi:hypothetical protein